MRLIWKAIWVPGRHFLGMLHLISSQTLSIREAEPAQGLPSLFLGPDHHSMLVVKLMLILSHPHCWKSHNHPHHCHCRWTHCNNSLMWNKDQFLWLEIRLLLTQNVTHVTGVPKWRIQVNNSSFNPYFSKTYTVLRAKPPSSKNLLSKTSTKVTAGQS